MRLGELKTYRHIVDVSGAHWLSDSAGNLFNGASWVGPKSVDFVIAEDLGEVSIPDFIERLASMMNYREAL